MLEIQSGISLVRELPRLGMRLAGDSCGSKIEKLYHVGEAPYGLRV